MYLVKLLAMFQGVKTKAVTTFTVVNYKKSTEIVIKLSY